jgi:hypothetical protein
VTCKTVTSTVTRRVHGKRKRIKISRHVCTVRTLTGPVKFTSSSRDQAVLARAGVIYARGAVIRGGEHPELLLRSEHRLRRGRYTLTLTSRHGRKNALARRTITIG